MTVLLEFRISLPTRHSNCIFGAIADASFSFSWRKSSKSCRIRAQGVRTARNERFLAYHTGESTTHYYRNLTTGVYSTYRSLGHKRALTAELCEIEFDSVDQWVRAIIRDHNIKALLDGEFIATRLYCPSIDPHRSMHARELAAGKRNAAYKRCAAEQSARDDAVASELRSIATGMLGVHGVSELRVCAKRFRSRLLHAHEDVLLDHIDFRDTAAAAVDDDDDDDDDAASSDDDGDDELGWTKKGSAATALNVPLNTTLDDILQAGNFLISSSHDGDGYGGAGGGSGADKTATATEAAPQAAPQAELTDEYESDGSEYTEWEFAPAAKRRQPTTCFFE